MTEDSPVDPAWPRMMRPGLAGISGPAVEDDVAAARQVGEALRRVIDRLTATSAPPAVLREAVERLAAVEDLLRPYHSVRSYSGASEASGLGRDRAFYDWSPLFGLANPLAPPIRVAVEDEMLVGRVRFGIAYEGPPGCVHGGFVAAAFDELLGLTQSLSGKAGMTGTLTVKYRSPTPLHTELRAGGTASSRCSGRKVLTSGRMLAGDRLTAEASGLFISIRPEDFTALAVRPNRERRVRSGRGGGRVAQAPRRRPATAAPRPDRAARSATTARSSLGIHGSGSAAEPEPMSGRGLRGKGEPLLPPRPR